MLRHRLHTSTTPSRTAALWQLVAYRSTNRTYTAAPADFRPIRNRTAVVGTKSSWSLKATPGIRLLVVDARSKAAPVTTPPTGNRCSSTVMIFAFVFTSMNVSKAMTIGVAGFVSQRRRQWFWY